MADQKFNINPRYRAKSKSYGDLDYFVNGILDGDKLILSEAITLVESFDSAQKELGQHILQNLPKKSSSIRVAITGAPGAGKSTFIETFGALLCSKDFKVAVLAIDPSSHVFQGSILGDKTRMNILSQNPLAYIRPTSAGSLMGGVANGTKEAITLCEAAGFHYIFIETVGVGQSEYWASNMSDITLCLLQPGAGDELQGIKRGILEMADLLLISKTDGTLQETALTSAQSYKSVVQLFPQKIKGRNRFIFNISSHNGLGLEEVFDNVTEHFAYLKENGILFANRLEQEASWFRVNLKEEFLNFILTNQETKNLYEALRKDILNQKTTTLEANKRFFDYLDLLINR